MIRRLPLSFLLLLILASCAVQEPSGRGLRKVRGTFQTRPGGPVVNAEVAVGKAPVGLASVSGEQAGLGDDELVLGLVLGGHVVAYPVSYLARFEIVDDEVGKTPIAATW